MTRMTYRAQQETQPELVAAIEPEGIEEPGEIVERPDGFYWKSPEGPDEYGPFESLEAARANRDAVTDEPAEGTDALHEVERDIGINDWIDAETGEPAEGQSPPHLEEE